jgi:fumarylacetoacetase
LIVTREALEPFRVQGPVPDPIPLPYLRQSGSNNYDVNLDITLRAADIGDARRICRTNFKYMYWSSVQQLVHHASSGCSLNVGDLLGSGTISGPEKDQRGSLLELSWGGAEPLELGSVRRTFLEDGDSVTITGYCQGNGYRVGFGGVEGTIIRASD